jgi:hypothetical protein
VQGALMAGGVGAEEARRAVNAGLARIYATRRSRARRVRGGICGDIFAVGMVVVVPGWVPITVPLRAVYGAVGAAVRAWRGWRMRPEAPALLESRPTHGGRSRTLAR